MAEERSLSTVASGTSASVKTEDLEESCRGEETPEDTGSSPQASPKRKPLSLPRERRVVVETRRRKTWRSRLMNSIRRKTKRGRKVAASSGSFVTEATDFSFRLPSRESPSASAKKRGSPSFFHLTKRGSQGSLSYENVKIAIADDVDSLPYEIRGGTPLHFYVWTDSLKKNKRDFLVSLLTAGEVDVDSKSDDGNTPLHLAVKKGDLDAVKVLVAFGADVNLINMQGQTPLDIATTGYVNQERKLTLTNAAINGNRSRQQSREGSPRPSNLNPSHQRRESPLLSTFVPRRLKFMDCDLDGDYEGWVCVDFSSGGPPIKRKPVSFHSESRLRDLTEPVNITLDDVTTHNILTTTSRVIKAPSPKNGGRLVHTATAEVEEQLRQSYDDILNLLHVTGAMSRYKLQHVSSKPLSLSGQHMAVDLSMELQRSIRLGEYERGTTILSLYETLEDTINGKMEELSSLGDLDEALALALQQQEMKRYNKTLQMKAPEKEHIGIRAGSRVLCLDGGGIRGLLQVEVLSQIERVTGRRIVDLFDWIIGTSTGALIALGLVYGDMSLEEIRRLYFKIKDEVFLGNNYGFDTPTLERLLQDTFPAHVTMNCPTNHSTKVLVAAVYKKMAPPQLHFFNNCFNDEFSKQPVWKVARYTTAAPMFFKECDNYVDGGVLANNPSETGLTAIQNFHQSKGLHLPIALVVSVGSGIYPAKELGRIDVQDFLFFGKQWLNFQDPVHKRAKNLIQLLTNALLESEMVAENTKARCEGQSIPFYRFSPNLTEIVATGETDNGILINMILSAAVQTVPQMEALASQFQMIAEANQKKRFRMRKSNNAATV